ncbi:hypothetical protein CYMTET_6343 [Cymbomonas tetramitiformis]|uniref:J domain-containing protein n=1 Tax=Cymbomonas tetramitiformis TaxID=36881 RepID=A0AAE0LI59_9CHLO|nr:hypothetical protein CYMTET_6343 [Cymbomonas tetramitiformis]
MSAPPFPFGGGPGSGTTSSAPAPMMPWDFGGQAPNRATSEGVKIRDPREVERERRAEVAERRRAMSQKGTAAPFQAPIMSSAKAEAPRQSVLPARVQTPDPPKSSEGRRPKPPPPPGQDPMRSYEEKGPYGGRPGARRPNRTTVLNMSPQKPVGTSNPIGASSPFASREADAVDQWFVDQQEFLQRDLNKMQTKHVEDRKEQLDKARQREKMLSDERRRRAEEKARFEAQQAAVDQKLDEELNAAEEILRNQQAEAKNNASQNAGPSQQGAVPPGARNGASMFGKAQPAAAAGDADFQRRQAQADARRARAGNAPPPPQDGSPGASSRPPPPESGAKAPPPPQAERVDPGKVDKKAWERHETMMAKFEKSPPNIINFDKVPWPPDPEVLLKAMVELIPEADRNEQTEKKAYRKATLRWHPDKFQNKFGTLLLEKDKERILQKVKDVSQVINMSWDNKLY